MAAQASATGTLGGTPVAHLLIYALDRGLTGTLVIEDGEGKKSALTFRAGTPSKVKAGESVARLSEVLVDAKALDRATAESTFAAARADSKLHGAFLVEQRLVDRAALDEALAEQVARKVEWLATLPPASVFGYYEGQDFLLAFGGADVPPVEPLELIWRALRRGTDAVTIDTALTRLGDREVRLHPHSRIGRFGFDARERGVLDVLRSKPQPLPSLVSSGLLPAMQLKRVLYALVVTRHIDLGGAQMPVGIRALSGMPAAGSVPSPPPAAATAANVGSPLPPAAARAEREAPQQGNGDTPPAGARAVGGPSEEANAFRAEIFDRTARIGSQNYYEILGVDRKADPSTIQGAFFMLAKRWHPDRLGPEFADVREAALRIFARMSEAHQVLMNEEQRSEYERLMKEGGSTADEQEMVQRVLRAAAAFQKAEVLARRGNTEEALQQANIAVENDGEQAEYVALYADLLSQNPERAKTGSYADVVKLANEAKKRQPQNLKVRLYRARILKRSGDAEGAYKEFRAIVEQDATNVEAAREVRLHQMRRGKSTTDPQKTGPRPRETGGEKPKEAGLFGKLFKR